MLRRAPLRRCLLLVAVLAASSLAAGAPSSGRAAPPDPIVAALGDIACPPAQPPGAGSCRQAAVAALVAGLAPDAVLALGDLQYPCGFRGDFAAAFGQSWGALLAKLRPVPGNHEYDVRATGSAAAEAKDRACAKIAAPSDAAGYYGFFGKRATPLDPKCRKACDGWYSFDLGAWHIVALNSNCEVVACGVGSRQERWLQADLGAHPAACTLAMWHHPRFSSGVSGDRAGMEAIWRDLHRAGADVVLNGHDHDYERFAPLDADGFVDKTAGVREFVVGTGGVDLYAFPPTAKTGSEARIAGRFGALTLALHPDGYDWAFHPLDGAAPLDRGHGSCHGAPKRP